MPLSIRLTVTYAFLVLATLFFVAGLTLRLTRAHLVRELDRRLVDAVRSFQEGPARRAANAADLAREARNWLSAYAFSFDEFEAVRTTDGIVLTTPQGLNLQQVPGASALLATTRSQSVVLQGANGPILARAVPITLRDRQIGTLVVAASLTMVDMTVEALLSDIARASALGLALAVLLSFGAIRRTLAPLALLSRKVEGIQQTGDLSRRLVLNGADDEVGRLAEAFDRMVARLAKAFRSQQRFLSDASHELRTPLTVARGYLELLGHRLERAEERRSLTIAAEELDRMRRIVDELLLLARLDEGLSLTRQPVEVELVMREALLRSLLQTPLETNVEFESGLFALADPDRLLQVFTNLVMNAVEHAGRNVKLTMTGRKEVNRVIITVSDSGPGIPSDELPHIFERFYRGSRARSAAGGAGLGLPIAASLVEAMGGEIECVSGPNGTTFTVRLPAVEVPLETLPQHHPGPVHPFAPRKPEETLILDSSGIQTIVRK